MKKLDGKKYPRSFGKSFVVKKIDDLGSEDFAMAVAHDLSLRYVFAESIFNTSQISIENCTIYIHDDNHTLGREGQLLRICRQDCSSNIVNVSLPELGNWEGPVRLINL